MKRLATGVALALVVVACSNSGDTVDGAEGTAGLSTTSPSRVTSQPVEDPSAEEILLDELGREVQSWGISASSWECVATGLIEGGFLDGVVDLSDVDDDTPLSQGAPQLENFIQGMITLMRHPDQGCLSSAEIAAAEGFFAANAEGPLTYGSDPARDMLHDGCQEGSMPDCDMLYLLSEAGSKYGDQAVTCGSRNEPIEDDTTCMIEYEDLAGFDELAQQCESGFLVACDALYVVAPLGSPEEALAATCGGLRETAYVIPCWISFGIGAR